MMVRRDSGFVHSFTFDWSSVVCAVACQFFLSVACFMLSRMGQRVTSPDPLGKGIPINYVLKVR